MRSCLNKLAYNQTALVDKQPLSLPPSFLKPTRVPSDPCDSCDSLLFPEPLAPPCKLQRRGLQPVMGWGSRAGASTLFGVLSSVAVHYKVWSSFKDSELIKKCNSHTPVLFLFQTVSECPKYPLCISRPPLLLPSPLRLALWR